MKKLVLTSTTTLALLVAACVSTSWAQDCGCADPGCGCANGACAAGGCGAGGCGGCGVGKVCRLVKKEKEVTVTCYGTKCKDICVPGCGSKCTNVDCIKCGKCSCDSTAGLCKAVYATGKPGCAKVKTVKQLVKYETTKKVCTWEWEIVDACCGCDGCGACGDGCGAGDGCGCVDGACATGPDCGCARD